VDNSVLVNLFCTIAGVPAIGCIPMGEGILFVFENAVLLCTEDVSENESVVLLSTEQCR